MIYEIFEKFSALPQVEAICLGGSRAGENYDEKSDYDVYIYLNNSIDEAVRKEILAPYCSKMEIGNHYWELEDNFTMNNGIDVDFVYRKPQEFFSQVADVVENCNPYNGYTTCMWHNLINSKVIFDRNGMLEQAQKRFSVPYPEKLRENIIKNNFSLLRDSMPAYSAQIMKASKRGDTVSINHRVAEFLASYFDILFALNHQTHPGEKRLVSLCRKNCELLPENFEENINALFSCMFNDNEKLEKTVENIVNELAKILQIKY